MLYVMQGAPGSGKSTVARAIKGDNPRCFICSTDDYHVIDGKYVFQPDMLRTYHAMNLGRAKAMLDMAVDVIVDNTNIRRWECREYVRYAHDKGITIVFIRVEGRFGNIHGVPADRVEAMRAAMESLTIESVLASKAPWEDK